MFVEECRRAIMASPLTGLDALSKGVWRAYGAGVLDDAEAGSLCELIATRRVVPTSPPPKIPRRVGSRPRSSASIERRRAWTASGWMPPAMAARFTPGEQAAMAVVISEVARAGRCGLPLGAIAGRAGVCATTARNALRQACMLGLVAVEERRLSYDRSLPNLITIVGRELALWVRTRGRMDQPGGGCKTVMTTTNHLFPNDVRPSAAMKAREVGRSEDVRGHQGQRSVARPSGVQIHVAARLAPDRVALARTGFSATGRPAEIRPAACTATRSSRVSSCSSLP